MESSVVSAVMSIAVSLGVELVVPEVNSLMSSAVVSLVVSEEGALAVDADAKESECVESKLGLVTGRLEVSESDLETVLQRLEPQPQSKTKPHAVTWFRWSERKETRER